MKPEKLALFVVAVLFGAAHRVKGLPSTAKNEFDSAQEFIDEGKKRGIDLNEEKG